MDLLQQTSNCEPAGGSPGADGLHPALAVGAYLTDGAKLLRVAHTLPCSVEGERFVALEDCVTLEIVLCPARTIMESRLRPVTPAGGD